MPSPTEALHATLGELGAWLRERAWPLWLTHGVDWRTGGFHEWLDAGLGCAATHRRLRVAARQTIVFSLAAREGVPRAADAARLGLEVLRRHAPHADGGYVSRFTLPHAPEPGPRDTYDHAFVLLAFAAAAAIAPPADLHAEARALAAWMDQALAHPEGGYREGLPDALPRRQNPHMHLLEAFQAAHTAFGDRAFLRRASGIVTLFLDRLRDPDTGALPEYFTAGWSPLREDGAFLIEPGHHCEWAWLLQTQLEIGGPEADPRLAAAGAALMAFVDRCGAAPAGGLANAVDSAGRLRDPATRLWPQAERLKAEMLRADTCAERQLAASRELQRRLLPDGRWHERLNAAGQPVEEPAPASSLYHVTGAILLAERALREASRGD